MAKRLEPIHPGEILYGEFMRPLKLSQNRLAQALRIPTPRIGEIVNGRRAITSATALRLARFFGTTPDFWVHLQSQYDLARARDAEERTVEREVQPLTRPAMGQ